MYNGPKQWNKTDHFRYIVLSTIWMLCVACANTRAFDEEEEKKTHNNNNDNRRAIAKAIYSITITIQSIQMNRTIVNEIVRNTGHTFQFHQLSTVCKTMSHCHCSIDDDETFCCVYCSLSLSCALWIRTIFISIEAYNKNPKRREHFMSKKRCEHRTNRTTTEEKKKHFKNHLTVCFCELWLTLRGGVSPFVFAHSEWILYARITWINVFNRNSCFVCPVFPYAGAIRWHLPYIRWSNMVKILHTERCCTFEAWNVVREWLAERADRKWFIRSPEIVEFNEKIAENEVKNQYTDNYELEWYLRVEKSHTLIGEMLK